MSSWLRMIMFRCFLIGLSKSRRMFVCQIRLFGKIFFSFVFGDTSNEKNVDFADRLRSKRFFSLGRRINCRKLLWSFRFCNSSRRTSIKSIDLIDRLLVDNSMKTFSFDEKKSGRIDSFCFSLPKENSTKLLFSFSVKKIRSQRKNVKFLFATVRRKLFPVSFGLCRIYQRSHHSNDIYLRRVFRRRTSISFRFHEGTMWRKSFRRPK